MTKLTRLSIAVLILSACANARAAVTPDEVTSLTYDDTVSDLAPSKLSDTCPINIVGITDQRFSKESIGADFPIVASAPEPWVAKGLERLKAYGFTVQYSATPVADALNLNVGLIRAYTWFGNLRINGMVAFDVELLNSSGKRTEKYRALGSKTNMWNNKTEHVTALNYAFNHTMHAMAQSLQAECVQAKLAVR